MYVRFVKYYYWKLDQFNFKNKSFCPANSIFAHTFVKALDFTSFYFYLFYFILLYFILFYFIFILFYFKDGIVKSVLKA